MSGELSIRFYALAGSPHITQAPAYGATILSAGEQDQALTIVGVYLNGAPRKFRAMGDGSVSVSPAIPFEGDRVELRCLAPNQAPEALQPLPATYPLTDFSYGLQAPKDNERRTPQWDHDTAHTSSRR